MNRSLSITFVLWLLVIGNFARAGALIPNHPGVLIMWGEKSLVSHAGWGRMVEVTPSHWLRVDTLYSHSGSVLQIEGSDDTAHTWTPVGTVAEPGRRLDNGALIVLPGHTILLTCRSVIKNCSFHLPVYRSVDGGVHWSFLSEIASNDRVIHGNSPSQGLWEPYFFLLSHHRIAVSYSSEMHSTNIPSYSQVCSERISNDGGKTWGPEIILAAQPGGGSLRPGMPVVTQMANGKYIALFEVVGLGDADVNEKISPDGVQWPAGLGAVVPDQHAGPCVLSLPNGALLASSCSNQISYSDNFGRTWDTTLPAFDNGQELDFPALYSLGQDRVACMVSHKGVWIRFGVVGFLVNGKGR